MNRSASFAGPDDLSHAWPEASLCNAEQPKEQEIAYLCGIRYLQQCSDTPDRTLVMRLGQRFESARRLSLISLDKPYTQIRDSLRFIAGGFLTTRWRYLAEVCLRASLASSSGAPHPSGYRPRRRSEESRSQKHW